MSVKILAFDLDGTALAMHKNLSDRNRAALSKAAEQGVILVPATGRIRSFLPQDIVSLPNLTYAITANGGTALDLLSGQILYSANIPNTRALEVQSILDSYEIYIEYYVNGTAVTLLGTPEKALNDVEFPASKHHFLTKEYQFIDNFSEFLVRKNACPEKINLPYLPEKVRSELHERLRKIPDLKITSSISDNLEINSTAATKGQALEALCQFLGISREDCMALGDNGNDVDMLSFAGVSVAMGNASEEAKKASRFITGNCDSDGLAEAIEKFVL